ncbi:hypothetical protein LTR08_002970 [Meristemomyces frigidus]|nr:hypothetical protein LTR08_002970 [Meristemomyces frigidus]
MDVLSANATRRDAKPYLARFKVAKPGKSQTLDVQAERARPQRSGVNLGDLYAPSRAIADSPQFVQQNKVERASTAKQQPLHVALVCLRAPEALDDATLEGVAITLSQLVKLDTRIVLVLDLNVYEGGASVVLQKIAIAEQAERVQQALRRHSAGASRLVTSSLECEQASGDSTDGDVSLALPMLVMEPLRRGIVLIIPCLAYTPSGQLQIAPAGDVMAALTKGLYGLHDEEILESHSQQTNYNTSLDRIIVLDPAGGIPSKDRGDYAHVFVNLEQEFDGIYSELSEYSTATHKNNATARIYDQHKSNLSMLNRCLAMLPSASSALIISPHEVARSSQASAQEPTIGTGTRRQKNTLIHNLLTNKPMVSSSLPTARLPSTTNSSVDPAMTAANTATLVKKGMPLTIIPAADRTFGWQLPTSGRTPLLLESDPRVDFARLTLLIEDSFRRELNIQHYLDRISGRIAGLIVAGNYEGAAILTWEQPPGTTDPARLVPYLDKFAVLQSSQGSSGVADILFQAMVRTAFPAGVCWRSRQDNPVNKWYFERAAGSWQIPGTQWTLFWTGEGVVENEEKWEDYVSVCRSVLPSWADGKRPD